MKGFTDLVMSLIIFVVLVISLSSCATFLKNSSQDIEFSSEPTGAEVYANGKLLGTTPVKIRLKSKITHTLEFKKEGYKTRKDFLNNHISTGWLILDLVCGVIPIAVDAITGDWYSLDQENVNGILDK